MLVSTHDVLPNIDKQTINNSFTWKFRVSKVKNMNLSEFKIGVEGTRTEWKPYPFHLLLTVFSSGTEKVNLHVSSGLFA